VKLWRVVEFMPGRGGVFPINNTLYRSFSQAQAMRTRYLRNRGFENTDRVFIQETETDWVKTR
jgi:hypothetical protein